MIKKNHLDTSFTTKRTIVISDIHGYYDLFIKLLNKLSYDQNNDTLVILGDMIEKGPDILKTLDYLMNLNKKHLYILNGNCEWAIYNIAHDQKLIPYIKGYMDNRKESIFHEILDKHHIDYQSLDDHTLQKTLQKLLKPYFDFINTNYITLETDQYIFVHAGIEQRIDYRNSSLSSLLEQQRFYDTSHPLDKYVIVGHLPVSNYHTHHIDNEIIIDDTKKVICIDGGVGVKSICQLNALVLSNHIETHYVRDFPICKITNDVTSSIYHHHKIAWPNFHVQLLQAGEEFSLCKKDNDELLHIKNEFLYEDENELYCKDDYEDYQMSIQKGCEVEILGYYGKYAYALYKNEVFWVLKDYLKPTSCDTII